LSEFPLIWSHPEEPGTFKIWNSWILGQPINQSENPLTEDPRAIKCRTKPLCHTTYPLIWEKMKLFRGLVIYLVIIFCFSGCSIVTFYGAAPKTINSEQESIRVYWNYWVKSEEKVISNLNGKILELLKENAQYCDYIPLYQSNNSLRTGKRLYKIKFFSTKDEKQNFLEDSKQKEEEFNDLVASKEFLDGWQKLKIGMTVEQTFDLLPELLNFDLIKDFQEESIMIYKINGIELVFDRNGRLMSGVKRLQSLTWSI
jgi:hypothetical protein